MVTQFSVKILSSNACSVVRLFFVVKLFLCMCCCCVCVCARGEGWGGRIGVGMGGGRIGEKGVRACVHAYVRACV